MRYPDIYAEDSGGNVYGAPEKKKKKKETSREDMINRLWNEACYHGWHLDTDRLRDDPSLLEKIQEEPEDG